MAEVGIRDYLKRMGYGDSDITYDNGAVNLKGRYFTSAVPKADEKTYGDESALSSALKNYSNTGYNNEINNTLGQMKTAITAPREKFSYDPNTDPEYQTALSQALKNAQTGTNNALVTLGSRGIANSSVALDRAQQEQQGAVADVTSNVLPKLIQQAYQRYQDNQAYKQQDIGNLGSYLNATSGQMQQGLDNQYRNKTFDRNILESDRNYGLNKSAQDAQMTGYYNPNADQIAKMNANSQAWFGASPDEQARLAAENQDIGARIGATQDSQGNWIMPQGQQTTAEQQRQIQNGQWDKQFMSGEDQRAFENNLNNRKFALDERQTNASIANASSDNVRAAAAQALSAGNAQLATKFDVWDRTGYAPDGIPGVPVGTQIAGKASVTKIDEKTSADNYNALLDDLKDPSITKEEAKKLLQVNRNGLSDSDYKKFMDEINNRF